LVTYPDDVRDSLSHNEIEFFNQYDRILGDYMTEIELDLTADFEPPKDLYIEVRVLKDEGEITTINGTINLKVNTTHYLRRSDVEHLIRRGVVEHIA